MKKIINLVVIVMIFSFVVNAQSYEYHINLNNIENDKLKVELECPAISSNEIIYYFPKTLPGTDMPINYGRYISKFSAYNKDGEKIKVKKVDVNSFKILNAYTLKRIEYTVDDAFDKKEKKKQQVFQSEKNKYFVFSNGGIFGCFEKMENTQIVLNITKNKDLEGSSSLNQQKDKDKSIFIAKNYHELIDCLILFTTNKPKTLKMGYIRTRNFIVLYFTLNRRHSFQYFRTS